MPRITIVTHCWAVQKPHYAAMLHAQLSSIRLTQKFGGTVSVDAIVVCDANDAATERVLSLYQMADSCVLPLRYPEAKFLWRRAIGRHRTTTLASQHADLLWFTDCDYLFFPPCFDFVYAEWERQGRPAMIWPRGYIANQDRREIDQFCAEIKDCADAIKLPAVRLEGGAPAPNWSFTPCKRAIGGLQCVSGAFAKEHGYLPNSKWQNPPDRPFPDFIDDVKFRKYVAEKGRIVDVPEFPGFFRMRHTEVGYGADTKAT